MAKRIEKTHEEVYVNGIAGVRVAAEDGGTVYAALSVKCGDVDVASDLLGAALTVLGHGVAYSAVRALVLDGERLKAFAREAVAAETIHKRT